MSFTQLKKYNAQQPEQQRLLQLSQLELPVITHRGNDVRDRLQYGIVNVL